MRIRALDEDEWLGDRAERRRCKRAEYGMVGLGPTIACRRVSGLRFASPEKDAGSQYSPPVPEPTARPPPGATLKGVMPSPAAPITE